jgi:PhnB protein
MSFHPYLNFGGNTAEAFTRYQEIFGGELVLLRAGDMPGAADQMPPGIEDMVLHAALMTDDGHYLMASDSNESPFGPVQFMYVNYSTDDLGEAERVWKELSQDAQKIEMPFEATFFSPGFGVCVDKFGTPWMVNTASPDQPTA